MKELVENLTTKTTTTKERMFRLPILTTQYNNIFPHLVLVPPNNNIQIYRYTDIVQRALPAFHTLKHLDS